MQVTLQSYLARIWKHRRRIQLAIYLWTHSCLWLYIQFLSNLLQQIWFSFTTSALTSFHCCFFFLSSFSFSFFLRLKVVWLFSFKGGYCHILSDIHILSMFFHCRSHSISIIYQSEDQTLHFSLISQIFKQQSLWCHILFLSLIIDLDCVTLTLSTSEPFFSKYNHATRLG